MYNIKKPMNKGIDSVNESLCSVSSQETVALICSRYGEDMTRSFACESA